MSDEVIVKKDWKTFCARVSGQLEGAQAEVEVASLGLGDQVETEWVGLVGITYDPKDNLFDVALDGIGHIVRDPISLAVAWSGATISSLAIETRSGDRHIVKFRRPLSLPPPAPSKA